MNDNERKHLAHSLKATEDEIRMIETVFSEHPCLIRAYAARHELEEARLPDSEYTERAYKEWLKITIDFLSQKGDGILTDGDALDIVLIADALDVAKAATAWLLNWSLNTDFEGFSKNTAGINSRIEPKEFASLLLSPPELPNFPPGHWFWKAQGVNNVSEWEARGGVFNFTQHCKLETINPLLSIFMQSLNNKFDRKGASDKLEYTSDEAKLDSQCVETPAYITDNDRLSQFCELTGIEMSDLTDGESSRVLHILNVLDSGYDFASKKGIPIEAYYGDRANSEKTQRSRLFKKIRETSDKTR